MSPAGKTPGSSKKEREKFMNEHRTKKLDQFFKKEEKEEEEK